MAANRINTITTGDRMFGIVAILSIVFMVFLGFLNGSVPSAHPICASFVMTFKDGQGNTTASYTIPALKVMVIQGDKVNLTCQDGFELQINLQKPEEPPKLIKPSNHRGANSDN